MAAFFSAFCVLFFAPVLCAVFWRSENTAQCSKNTAFWDDQKSYVLFWGHLCSMEHGILELRPSF